MEKWAEDNKTTKNVMIQCARVLAATARGVCIEITAFIACEIILYRPRVY